MNESIAVPVNRKLWVSASGVWKTVSDINSHQEHGEPPNDLHRNTGPLDPPHPLRIVPELQFDIFSRGSQGVQPIDGFQPLHTRYPEKLDFRIRNNLVRPVQRIRPDDRVQNIRERPDVFVKITDDGAVKAGEWFPDEHGGHDQDDGGSDVCDRDRDVRKWVANVSQKGDERVNGQNDGLRTVDQISTLRIRELLQAKDSSYHDEGQKHRGRLASTTRTSYLGRKDDAERHYRSKAENLEDSQHRESIPESTGPYSHLSNASIDVQVAVLIASVFEPREHPAVYIIS